MSDLGFISGEFFDYEIPKEKKFLLKYFTGDLQVAYLKYIMVFGDHKGFREHTGFNCAESLCRRLKNRYVQLTKLHDEVKKAFTEESMSILNSLESGDFKLNQLPK